jgi:hypothetical protein
MEIVTFYLSEVRFTQVQFVSFANNETQPKRKDEFTFAVILVMEGTVIGSIIDEVYKIKNKNLPSII